jgi:stage II sporulation protein D
MTLTPPILQIQSAGFRRLLPLTDTINVAATDSYFFAVLHRRSNVRQAAMPVTHDTLGPRCYSGSLKIYVTGNELCIINIVRMDDYLAGVLAAEMPNADLPALQAQAVVSRTYMVKNQWRHLKDGYQFCDLTHCQTYKGNDGATAKTSQAVADTKDEILAFERQPIAAYYSSTCGGRTADDLAVWANAEDQPYLKSVVDNFCAGSPHYRWRARILADSLHQIWQQRLGEPISSIAVAKTGEDGRVRELAMIGHSLHLISGEDFRAVTCRRFGWNTLKSTAFDLRLEKSSYVFEGRGLGHGLGLCQYGAMKMAQQGYSYWEILRHYFSETQLQKQDSRQNGE